MYSTLKSGTLDNRKNLNDGSLNDFESFKEYQQYLLSKNKASVLKLEVKIQVVRYYQLRRFKFCKVHIFWEGHKILRNLPLTFDCMYCSQK